LCDSSITILAIAGNWPPLITTAVRDRSMGASSANAPSKASAVLSIYLSYEAGNNQTALQSIATTSRTYASTFVSWYF
jgi:hypothetical protein